MWGVARTGAQLGGRSSGWHFDAEASRQIQVPDSNPHQGHFQFLLKLYLISVGTDRIVLSAGNVLEMFVIFLFHFLPFHFCLNFHSSEGGKRKGALCPQARATWAGGTCFLWAQGRAPTSSEPLFSFWWNTVPAIQLDLLDRLSVSSIFPKKRQSEVLASLYSKTVRRCLLVRFWFSPISQGEALRFCRLRTYDPKPSPGQLRCI